MTALLMHLTTPLLRVAVTPVTYTLLNTELLPTFTPLLRPRLLPELRPLRCQVRYTWLRSGVRSMFHTVLLPPPEAVLHT